MRSRALIALFVLALACTGAVVADPTTRPWSGHFAGGLSAPQAEASDVIEMGWNFGGGATWRPNSGPFGLRTDLSYNWWDADEDAINGFLDGDAQSLSLTLNAVWDFKTQGVVGFYIMGGIGGYWLSADLSVPTTEIGYWCDWWGWCYATPVTVETTVWDKDLYKFGYNVGAAITFRLPSSAQLYIEADYHWIQTSETSEYIPFVIGYRW